MTTDLRIVKDEEMTTQNDEQERHPYPLSVRYALPDIEDEELKRRSFVVNEMFAQDLYGLIDSWLVRYKPYFERFTASSIMTETIKRLEAEEHEARKRRKGK